MAKKGKATNQNQDASENSILNRLKNQRNLIYATALGLIIACAVILRILILRWGYYLNEFDPFFFYRIAEYVAKNGYSAYFTWHDTLSWYPQGRDIAHSSYLGNSFTAVFLYQFLNAIQLKVPLFNVAMFFPVLMASIVVIVAYFFGKDLGGKAVGLFTALFMAVSPSYLERTVAGFFDTECIGFFGMIATPLLFLRSVEAKKSLRNRVLYAVSGGLVMGYAFASWGAARYISSLLLLYIVVTLVMGKIEWRHIISYSITIGVGFLIALVIPRLGVSYLMNIENLAAIGGIGLLIVYKIIQGRLPETQARTVTLGLVALAVVGFIVLPYVGIGNPIVGKFLKVLNPFEDAGALYQSVGENLVTNWAAFFQDFGITIVLAALGAFFILHEGGDNKVYLLLFFLTAIYFASTIVRLTLILSFPVSILAAYSIVRILEGFSVVFTQKDTSKGRNSRRKQVGVSKGLSLIFILLLFGSLVPHFLNAETTAASPGPLASSSVPIQINGGYPTDWLKALDWLKANTTQKSVILSWWDYGYWIETIANRTTIIDGSTQNSTQIKYVADMMMNPENVSLPLMKRFNVDYVVVFITLNPNTPTQEWPFGDNAKWPQMANIAGLNVNDYYVYNSTSGQYHYSLKFVNTTIAGLMYGVADQSHFTKVYDSPLRWVRIYKVKY
jgi:dolichyl-diphosphooligosaccharide--protein glycosyltransferase